MPIAAATWAMLLGLTLHGGTGTGTSSAGSGSGSTSIGSSTTAGSSSGGTPTSGATDGSTTTGADGSEDASAGEAAEAASIDGSASATLTGADDAPSESSDAGVDPTFGPLDDGVDDDSGDDIEGCCDHPDNNSDNFLCRLGPHAPGKILLAVVLLLLGRPRRRGGSR